MYILDTNVLTELMKSMGEQVVLEWIDGYSKEMQFTTALNQAEILYGLAVMPKGRRRNELLIRANEMFEQEFNGRVLPFDERAATHYADIYATRKGLGRRFDVVDAQIAAVARANGMAVVTRDIRDFADCEIELVNPWDA